MKDHTRTDHEDRELLTAWAAGDDDAADELIRRHHRKLFDFLKYKLDRPDDIQEVMQQTYVELVRSRERYQGRGTFRAFLFGIARYKLFEYLRSRARDRLVLVAEQTAVEDQGHSPFSFFASRSEVLVLVRALRRISIDHQILLELHYWERLTVRELGDVYGSPDPTIRHRLRRARKLLRQQIHQITQDPEQTRSTMVGMETWAERLRRMTSAGASSTRSPSGSRDGADDRRSALAALVRVIPEGRVTTHASLGRVVGLEAARVANAIRSMADRDCPSFPWHRVVAEGGELAGSNPIRNAEQMRRLVAEGQRVHLRRVVGFSRCVLEADALEPHPSTSPGCACCPRGDHVPRVSMLGRAASR